MDNYSILCSVDKPLHNDLLAYCDHAYASAQQKIDKAKSAKKFIADVRFNQQIILYQKRERKMKGGVLF